tara:strand:- start:448 stop:573 length:126 start_codon:yes stop_codon:yes gene_type:complete
MGILATPGANLAATLAPRRYVLMPIYKLMGPFNLQRKFFAW